VRKPSLAFIVSTLLVFSVSACNCQLSFGKKKPVAAPSSDKQFVIAAQPVQGRIHGRAFIFESAQIENGILKIRQGKDFFADNEVKFFLFTPKGEIPYGKVFRIVEGEMSDSILPHIHVLWKEEGKSLPENKMYMNNYTLYLEFGEQNNKKLPGKIYLSISDDPATALEGTFEADIKGLVVIDGKPDLTTDSFETLKYVAETYIKNVHPNRIFQGFAYSNSTYTSPHPSKKHQTGYLEVKYRGENDEWFIERFQFIKEPAGWLVFNTLRKDQLHSAHPVEPPDPEEPLAGLFEYLLAKKIEEEVQRQFPGKALYTGMGFGNRCGYNPTVYMGDCKANYRVEGEKEPFEKSYLFRLTDKGWVLDRELEKNEKVNYKTETPSRSAEHSKSFPEKSEQQLLRDEDLFDAVEKGQTELVRDLLRQGADVDVRGIAGKDTPYPTKEWTPLLVASYKGYTKIAAILLENGADIHARNYGTRTPLMLAAEKGHVEIVKMLIAKGVDVRTSSSHDQWTPLHMAAYKGQTAVALILLEKGADPFVKNIQRATPLDYAKEKGLNDVVKVIEARPGK
jgi:hypothetical protein